MKSLLYRASVCLRRCPGLPLGQNLSLSLCLGLASTLLATQVIADSDRAIDHGPIGVMGDHFHKAGEWMVSARLMRMHMSGNQLGDDELSDSDVITQPNAPGRMPAVLSVVPQDMDMDMLMLGAMYAPSDRLTLMAMVMASSIVHSTSSLNCRIAKACSCSGRVRKWSRVAEKIGPKILEKLENRSENKENHGKPKTKKCTKTCGSGRQKTLENQTQRQKMHQNQLLH